MGTGLHSALIATQSWLNFNQSKKRCAENKNLATTGELSFAGVASSDAATICSPVIRS